MMRMRMVLEVGMDQQMLHHGHVRRMLHPLGTGVDLQRNVAIVDGIHLHNSMDHV